MFYLRVVPVLDGDLPCVQITDEHYRFLIEIEGIRPAISWLVGHGSCPGAADRLYDCEFGKTYRINGSDAGAGVGVPD